MSNHRVPLVGSIFLKDPLVATVELRRPGSDEPLIRLDGHTLFPGDTIEWKFPKEGIEFKFS